MTLMIPRSMLPITSATDIVVVEERLEQQKLRCRAGWETRNPCVLTLRRRNSLVVGPSYVAQIGGLSIHQASMVHKVICNNEARDTGSQQLCRFDGNGIQCFSEIQTRNNMHAFNTDWEDYTNYKTEPGKGTERITGRVAAGKSTDG